MVDRLEVAAADAVLVANRWGEGYPLLLLHGSGFDRWSWSAIAEHLQGRFLCLAPDQRGFGESAGSEDAPWEVLVEDTTRWVARFPEPPVLIGHSWGAKLALASAAGGVPCLGVYCIDGLVIDHGGSLSESVYDRTEVPVGVLLGLRSVGDPGGLGFTALEIDAWQGRRSNVEVDTIEAGHDMISSHSELVAEHITRFVSRLPGSNRPATWR